MDFKEMTRGIREGIEKRQIEQYGHVLTDEENDEEIDKTNKERKEQEKLERIGELTRRWVNQVPPRFKTATFDSFICSNAQQGKVIDYMKTGKSAVIYGKNGTGKTHLAYASCLYQTMKGKESKYVLAFDFFNKIRQSFNGGNPEEIVQELSGCDYLVIDEVDKTQGSPT
ncbi:MAG: ATP-binding protein, partial [Peptostreptococcaceae bacterium]|nr:ATP-binding protein [Peptostreptococcaceae bacterium]